VLGQPLGAATPTAVWLPRSNHHVGGNDLLDPPDSPNYFSKRETLVREYRIHSFLGRSIRAGIKVPREGVRQHEWIRSFDGGWKISYDNFESTEAQRKLAAKAVKTLGLDFGAVDIGEKADGTLMVLEINRAPGLEGGTVAAYANAIQRWLNGEFEPRPEGERRAARRR